MDLNRLYSYQRTGQDKKKESSDPRSQFQRDFDRIIFSGSFRRLQNKTQVFPLPGSVFVHNRLTHSLEVASVGRSLGSLIGQFICKNYKDDLTPASMAFYDKSLYNVVASACLCHDIGNPAFGHSGEDAISSFFEKNSNDLKPRFSEKEWYDLISFEGNANAIRTLSQAQQGKTAGGLKLTYATLATIAKYPCESIASDRSKIYRKKFGFFQSCKSTFQEIASATGMIKNEEEPLIYFRHPFVWLVEIADDICYNIIDLEDAHKLGIIGYERCRTMLTRLIQELGIDDWTRTENQLNKIQDNNESITYLRSKAINGLTRSCQEIYESNFEKINTGEMDKPIFDIVVNQCSALQEIRTYSVDNIYNNRSVVEIENAGYNVMYDLLDHFIPSILKQKSERKKSDKKALRLIPNQFLYETENDYEKVMGVLDYVSGMTDNYAADLFKKIKGIDIGMRM